MITGDKIRHKRSGNEYTVVSIDPFNDQFEVSSPSGALISFSLSHFDVLFEIIPNLPQGFAGLEAWISNAPSSDMFVKCECGVDSLGMGLHSDYCPKRKYNV